MVVFKTMNNLEKATEATSNALTTASNVEGVVKTVSNIIVQLNNSFGDYISGVDVNERLNHDFSKLSDPEYFAGNKFLREIKKRLLDIEPEFPKRGFLKKKSPSTLVPNDCTALISFTKRKGFNVLETDVYVLVIFYESDIRDPLDCHYDRHKDFETEMSKINVKQKQTLVCFSTDMCNDIRTLNCGFRSFINFEPIAEKIIKNNVQIILSATPDEINANDYSGKCLRDFIKVFAGALCRIIQMAHMKIVAGNNGNLWISYKNKKLSKLDFEYSEFKDQKMFSDLEEVLKGFGVAAGLSENDLGEQLSRLRKSLEFIRLFNFTASDPRLSSLENSRYTKSITSLDGTDSFSSQKVGPDVKITFLSDFDPIRNNSFVLSYVIDDLMARSFGSVCAMVESTEGWKMFDFGVMESALFQIRKHCFLRALHQLGLGFKKIIESIYDCFGLEKASEIMLLGEMMLFEVKTLISRLHSDMKRKLILSNHPIDAIRDAQEFCGEAMNFDPSKENKMIDDMNYDFINVHNCRMIKYDLKAQKNFTPITLNIDVKVHSSMNC
jgi:hypothetical protein